MLRLLAQCSRLGLAIAFLCTCRFTLWPGVHTWNRAGMHDAARTLTSFLLCSLPAPRPVPPPGPGVDMISKMLKMQMLEDEDDLAYAETEKKARTDSTSDGRPAWMRTLHTTASNWLHLIPQTLSHLKRTVENIKVARRWAGPPRGVGGVGSALRAGSGSASSRACGRLRPDSGVRADLLPGLHVHERGDGVPEEASLLFGAHDQVPTHLVQNPV